MAFASPEFDPSQLEFVDNGTIKLGVSKDLGGAITYLSVSGSDDNIINNFDWGRQVQMSFFSGPVPYTENGQEPAENWAHIGWNPIQAGDDFGNGSEIVELRVEGNTIYVKCIPKQWPLNNIPGECTYESFIVLKGNTAEVTARLVNARSDTTQYAGRHQELPAVYTNGPYYRLMTYRGDKPFTGDDVVRIPKKNAAPGEFPWDYWLATENWAALVNDDDWGLGLYKPDNSLFIGGFAGEEGVGGTTDTPTGYFAPLHTEILDHNIVYEYNYTLILGSLDEIRAHAVSQGGSAGLPDWKFEKDRQHWRYSSDNGDGSDEGWPIEGFIELDLNRSNLTAFSPPTVWQAEDAPVVHIEAAFNTNQRQATVIWSDYDGNTYDPTVAGGTRFNIIGDGEFRTYTVNLSSFNSYNGAMNYLLFQPSPSPEDGGWVRIKRIRLGSNVNTVPPTAQAGADQIVADNDDNDSETVMLDGSGSSDPDGSLVSYIWSKDGSPIASGVSPSVALPVGTHTITLTVTDDDGETDSDTVIITVGGLYDLTVISGTGDGAYATNVAVPITADAPQAGYQFNTWTTNDGGAFANASLPNTSFTMPDNDVTVTALYSAKELMIGAVDSTSGDVTLIWASSPEQHFDLYKTQDLNGQWTLVSENMAHPIDMYQDINVLEEGVSSMFYKLEPTPAFVRFISPSDEDVISGDVQIVANVYSPETIDRVQFFINGERAKNISEPPYEYTASGLNPGEHTIYLRMVDVNGDRTLSNTITITVE
ncbi:MAG: InlB B-repeat-containing protein [Opitutales bacterium]